jgi:hypothetical protein
MRLQMLLMTSFFLKNSSIPSSRSKNIRPNRCALGFGAGFVQAALKEGVLSEHGQYKMPNNLIFVETVIPPRGSLTTYINGDLRKNFEAFFRGVLNSAIFV